MSLLEELDFFNALRRVKNDIRNDPIYDVVGYRDKFKASDQIIAKLKQRLGKIKEFSANTGFQIEIPKKNYAIRPALIPNFGDRLLYQALADFLIKDYQPEPIVFSNIPRPVDSPQMFKPGVKSWLKFQDGILESCESYDYVMETDLTAYFEHIYHKILKRNIEELFNNKSQDSIGDVNILLGKLWNRWGTRYVRGFGIPQINDVSSFFGNVYLDELDKWLMGFSGPAFRFVDDIRIFSKDKYEARKNLVELIGKLRTMGLYISSEKTRIIDTYTVFDEINQRNKKIENIDQELESYDEERIRIASLVITDIIKEIAVEKESKDGRLFRFCINRLKKIKATGISDDIHFDIINLVINNFEDQPCDSAVYVDYLSMFPDNKEIQEKVLLFLFSKKNVYPWQEMYLLVLLIRSEFDNKLWNKWKGRIKQRAFTHPHYICSSLLLVLLGKNGDYSDLRELKAEYENGGVFKRRAIILAVQKLERTTRKEFYNYDCRITPESRYLVNYIEELNEPTYHNFNPPKGYEIFDEDYFDDSDDLREFGVEEFS